MIAPYVEERPAFAIAACTAAWNRRPHFQRSSTWLSRRLKSWKTRMSPSHEDTVARSTTRNALMWPSAESAPPVMTSISEGTGGKMASPITKGKIQK